MSVKHRKSRLGIKNTGFLLLLVSIIIWLIYSTGRVSFDKDIFDIKNVYKHTGELASSKYQGRRAGTDGNLLTLKYIENFFKENGIEPGGEDGSYYQNLQSIVPIYNSDPELRLMDSRGKLVKAYKYGSDFREVLSDFGGVGKSSGQILITKGVLKSYKPEEIKGRILLFDHIPRDDEMDYAVDNLAAGIVYTGNDINTRDIPDVSRKQGKTILTSCVSKYVYKELSALQGKGMGLEINHDITFKSLSTPNIIGKIQGSRKDSGYIIISTVIDGFGSDLNGRYFPGVIDSASGTAEMLEFSRALKLQGKRPEKTILFVGWNNSIKDYIGIKYYADNPLYPLDKTTVLVLDKVGGGSYETYIFSEETPGRLLSNRITAYGQEEGLQLQEAWKSRGLANEFFVKKNVPSVVIKNMAFGEGSMTVPGNPADELKNLDDKGIMQITELVQSYLKADVYNDIFSGLFTGTQFAIAIFILAGIIAIYLVEAVYRFNPSLKLGRYSVEDIYYSALYNIVLRFYKFFVPIVMVIFALTFISNMPINFNMILTADGMESNVSLGLVVKKSLQHMEKLLQSGLGKSIKGYGVMNVVSYSFIRSIRMVFFALIISFILGTLKGIIDGFRERKEGTFRILGTLSVLSLPDVLVVVVVQFLLAVLYKHDLMNPLFQFMDNSRFIIPFLCLSILPGVYISRITMVSVREEMKKDYVRAARAKGLSRGEVLRKHMLRPIISKVVDSLQSVLSIIISNLIVVEILFGYPSISSNLFSYMKERDTNVVIGLILALGVIYFSFSFIIWLLSKIINPFKREGLK